DRGFASRESLPVVTAAGHTDTVWKICLSADGRYLASAIRDNTLRLWEPRSGKEVRRLMGHGDWVRGADFSPDGKQLQFRDISRLSLVARSSYSYVKRGES